MSRIDDDETLKTLRWLGVAVKVKDSGLPAPEVIPIEDVMGLPNKHNRSNCPSSCPFFKKEEK